MHCQIEITSTTEEQHLICLPPTSKLDGINVDSPVSCFVEMASQQHDSTLLEEQVRKLLEELAQCQADKEFVWSLWKRLQVANPNLSQAISLVLEREKQKTEAKDRKILDILQVKDDKILELEQQVRCQQKEINNLIQRKIAVDEDIVAMQKEVTDLKEKLKNKKQDYKDAKERAQKSEEKNSLLLKNLEEEKQGLSTRCSDLLNDLEKQAAQWKEEKSDIDSKVKDLEDDLKEARKQVEKMHDKCNNLSSHLVDQQTELARKDSEITKFRKELLDLEGLYKESIEHAAQQAELIKQLQTLNLEIRKMLRNQEDDHASETKTYQKNYSDLIMHYDALKISEAQHQQRHFSMTAQLCQKEQQIRELLEKLHKALDSEQTAVCMTTAKDVEEANHSSTIDLQYQVTAQRSEIKSLKEKLKVASGNFMNLVDNKLLDLNFATGNHRRHQNLSVKRSRSLSPKNSAQESEETMKANKIQQKIENMEKLLKLKDQENGELRRSHNNRLERLRALQNNCRLLKGQVKELEEQQMKDSNSKGKMQRAEPWQLRQEDSDGVWNELAYFKREHRKLLTENMNQREELDQLKVESAVDKATILELTMCLQQEREELLFRLEEAGMKYSSPKTMTKEGLEHSLKKISHLERKLKTIQREAKDLRETNEELMQARASLKTAYNKLQSESDNQATEIGELMKANQCMKEEKNNLDVVMDEMKLETACLKRQIADMVLFRKENELLLQKIQELQEALASQTATINTGSMEGNSIASCVCKTVTYNPRVKRRKNNSMKQHQRFLNQSIKKMSNVFEHFSKDGWEDLTETSDSEETAAGSLGEIIVKTARQMSPTTTQKMTWSQRKKNQRNHLLGRKKTEASIVHSKVRKPKNKTLAQPRQSPSIAALQQRLISLQQQVVVVQNRKKAALNTVNELNQKNQILTSQLTLVNQKLQVNKQIIQKMTLDLVESQQQNDALDKRLNEMVEQQSIGPRSADNHLSLVSSQTRNTPTTMQKPVEAELKQLQSNLKNSANEISKHLTTIKTLKAGHQEKEDQIRQLQERVVHLERDVNMKRQLVEDLKSKLKANQESAKIYKGLLEEMENKVKKLTEESSTRKAFADSLKQRLNVATKERSAYEEMHRKTTGELDRKNQKLCNLKAKVIEAESAMIELETTASQQMHGLAMQSEQALEAIQKRLTLANGRVEELVSFVKALASELCREVQSRRTHLRRAKMKQLCHEDLSKESFSKAQTMAASILNISQSDLEDLFYYGDEEESEENKKASMKDQNWLSQIHKILEGQEVGDWNHTASLSLISGTILLWKHTRGHKTDPLVEEVQLLHANLPHSTKILPTPLSPHPGTQYRFPVPQV
ncbi:centlein isoform X2 [Narcine bancroftii]|uniref:centlein isoform X2 n=1 Tax=Narcine bancroftii TaxID=1343680 RepID=UPI003831CFB9